MRTVLSLFDFSGVWAHAFELLGCNLLDELRARGGALTSDEVALVRRTGAYTKRTLLWGRFAAPPRRRIEPIRCTAQGSWTQALGGARESTKAERSVTPEGFALAFAAAQVGASREKLQAIADRLCRAHAEDETRRRAAAGQQLLLGEVAV